MRACKQRVCDSMRICLPMLCRADGKMQDDGWRGGIGNKRNTSESHTGRAVLCRRRYANLGTSVRFLHVTRLYICGNSMCTQARYQNGYRSSNSQFCGK